MTKLRERYLTQIILLAMSLAFVVFLVVSAGANSDGVTGKSKTGCKPCHAASADLGTTVSITGLPSQFTPGETYLLNVTVTSTTVSGSNGGFDLSVTAGTLSTTDPNAQIVNNEATHTNNNARSWQVSWAAPTDIKSAIFFVAGQATNGVGTAGDAWNLQQYSISATGAEDEVSSEGERMQLWVTQVAVISVAIAFVSFTAVGIARKIEAKKEGKKHGGHT